MHAALGAESGRIALRMTSPPLYAFSSAPGWNRSLGGAQFTQALSSLLGVYRPSSRRPGLIVWESLSTCPGPRQNSYVKLGVRL